MGLIYITLSITCSLAIAQLLKVAELRKMNLMRILTVNYLAAFLISFFTAGEFRKGFSNGIHIPEWAIVMACVLGVVFIVNLMVYSKSIDRNGMGISIAAMRMSLIFPIGVSLIVFGESLALIRYAGIVVTFFSLILMLPEIKKKKISGLNDAWYPLIIFILTGMADTGMKVYERVFSSEISEGLFLSGVFIISFICGGAVLLYRDNVKFNLTEVLTGILIGVVNLYSSVFLIYALKLMPGSVVFPLVNVSLVIFGTMIGIMIWKDRPDRKQQAGLVLAVVSIILLLS